MNQQDRSSRVREVASDTTLPLSNRSARKRPGRPFSFLILLLGVLVGLFIGALGTLLYISSAHDAAAPTSQSVPGQTAIVIQLTPAYLSQVITKETSSANIPGNLQNIQVTMAHNAPITISGDEQVNLFGFSVTRRATVQLQPVVRACQVQVGITHADFSGIPVTTFVSPFEQQINQQLSNKGSGSLLPKGFIYCATDVHTETNGIFVTYSARSA